MQSSFANIVVAGHLCIDIILGSSPSGKPSIPRPGETTAVGPATVSTGGVVSNSGVALHRLGVPTRLLGKVGDDPFGTLLLCILSSQDPCLAADMIVASGEPTSYTVVVTSPDGDRGFMHCPGANDTFGPEDVALDQLSGAGLFHFGYPPLMRRMFSDGGTASVELFRRAKELGITTSLDVACPDPVSEAGQLDWNAFLAAVLPYVDLFMPSAQDLRVLLSVDDSPAKVLESCDECSRRFIEFGAAAVAVKLGENGLYLRSSADPARWRRAGSAAPPSTDAWLGRTLLAPCFTVDVMGTTGAGDATCAGFLAAFSRGCGPKDALLAATATGAHGVERSDATSGIPGWEAVWTRVHAGWAQRPVTLPLDGWVFDEELRVYRGMEDSGVRS